MAMPLNRLLQSRSKDEQYASQEDVLIAVKGLMQHTKDSVSGVEMGLGMKLAKILDDRFDKALGEELNKRIEVEVNKRLTIVQEQYDKHVTFLQKAFEDAMQKMADTVSKLYTPTVNVQVPENKPIVRITVPKQEAVFNVPVPEVKVEIPPHKPLQKHIEYNAYGQPSVITEKEI